MYDDNISIYPLGYYYYRRISQLFHEKSQVPELI